MNLQRIQNEAAALPPAERKQLIGFLVALNVTEEEREMMARKIDDRDASHWLTLDQLDEKLKALDGAAG